jgi:glycosyltransferase involved in cell wall biosynthesis
MGDRPLRIGFVGPAVGRHAGRVTTQGEVLADHFASSGFAVHETSAALRPARRAVEIASDLLRWGRDVDVLVVSAFSGRSFLYADIAIHLARLLRRPAVVVLHGGKLPEFAERHPRWVSRVLRRAARVVAPSPYLTRWARGCGWDTTEIPNLLPAAPALPRHLGYARPRLLWMRAFEDIYDPLTAVDVVARVARHAPNVRLTMAGQWGPLRVVTERRCRELGVRDIVRFADFLGPCDKAREFGGHDIFLHTSKVDNAPVSVLEAMAWGLVVVATPAGGLPDLVADGVSGLLAPAPGDAAALVTTVDRVLTEDGLATRLSRGASEAAQRNRWSAVEPQWLALLAEVT